MSEKKIIILGIISTILSLLIAGLVFYFVYDNNTSNKDNNESINVNTDNNTSSNLDNRVPNNELNNPTSNNTNNSNKTVTVYLFWGNGCPHCEHAKEFLESIADNYTYLEIISYEIWYNDENANLLRGVSEELEMEYKTSVPLIIIGNNYAKRGFSDGSGSGIISEIEKAYQDDNYEDVIKKVLETNNLTVKGEVIE